MSRTRLAQAFIAAAIFSLAAESRAGDLSLRAGAYTDADSAFVGIEYRTPIEGHLYLAPNFELVFPESGSYFSMNADLHYLIPSRGRLQGWLGGGLGIYARDAGGGRDTNIGVNFLGGLALRSRWQPYAQLKIAFHGDTATVLGFGIRF